MHSSKVEAAYSFVVCATSGYFHFGWLSVRKVAVNETGWWETRKNLWDVVEYKSVCCSLSFSVVAAQPRASAALEVTDQAV